jgi:hypothetical protein
MMLRRLPWRYLLVALIAAALGGLAGFGIGRVAAARRWPDLTFASDRWKAAPHTERYVFWNDIDRRRLLIGKSRDETVQILGTPGWESATRDRLTYMVKDARGEYNLTFIYFLDVRFDRGGRVASVSIGTD